VGQVVLLKNSKVNELVCLDPIPEMLRVAEPRVNKSRIGMNGFSEATFVEGKAEKLPFDDNSF